MNATAGILFIVFLVALLAIGPILTILSLNTLFALAIPLNFWTWLSTVWLGVFLKTRFNKSE